MITLDASAAEAVIRRDRYPPDLTTNKYSNFLRGHLLAEQGGVWADATLLCLKPLDGWLPQIFAQTDFFAFARPGADRMLSNWFLAAAPGAPAMKAWTDHSERLLKTHPGSEKPYFWFHYTFEYLYRRSPSMRRAWAAVPQISADPLHRLQRCLARGTFSEADWATILASPVQKLTYKKPRVPAGLADALRELERRRSADPPQ